jgi:pyrimidine-specific ribonucleoside hydrolase
MKAGQGPVYKPSYVVSLGLSREHRMERPPIMRENLPSSLFALIAAILVCLALLGPGAAQAHLMRAPLIVDTDLALDDVRALALITGLQHYDLRAVVTSDGICPPAASLGRLPGLFRYLKAPLPLLGAGRALSQKPPAWRKICGAAYWSRLPTAPPPKPRTALEALSQVLQNATEPVTYLCLGPMSNLAELLEHKPKLAAKIGSVVYLGALPDAKRSGFDNTSRDLKAASKVFGSGLTIYAMPKEAGAGLNLDGKLLEALAALNSPAARLVQWQTADPMVRSHAPAQGLPMWDELIVLWLHDPSLAVTKPTRYSRVQILSGLDKEAVRLAYLELASDRPEGLEPRRAVLFNRFPSDPAMFRPDVAPLVLPIIARHGLEEYKAALITNELHRHLGLLSIVGAKMGIRARELLHANLDEVKVKSEAGLKPPLSCLNDGLQASTGASLGRGTISMKNGPPRVAALFSNGKVAWRLELKPEVRAKIQKQIKDAVQRFPGLTPRYFQEVRRMALKGWLEMDRREIFIETNLTGNK